MPEEGRESAARATGHLLADLLQQPGSYRARWRRYVQRDRGTDVNQAAVSAVIANYLEGIGQPEHIGVTRRSLKDRVGRALNGSALTAETLSWFVDAFMIKESDQERLWHAFGDDRGEKKDLGTGEQFDSAGRPWRTVALQEHHYIGPDGLPYEHHTHHVLVALQDGVDHYPFTFDTSEATVEVVRGGTPGKLRPVGGGLHTVNIAYDEPLHRGETASFEYRVRFTYSAQPPPEFRRRIRGYLSSLLIRVSFHPLHVPAGIWWAGWSDLGVAGQIVQQEPAPLRSGNAVYKYLEDVCDTIVGFYWRW